MVNVDPQLIFKLLIKILSVLCRVNFVTLMFQGNGDESCKLM